MQVCQKFGFRWRARRIETLRARKAQGRQGRPVPVGLGADDHGGLVGWWMGRMEALPERAAIVLPVYRHDLDEVVPMSLEEYVMGVVAAEMPANFHLEALKAQAVAARTLALHLLQENRPLANHPRSGHQHRFSHSPGVEVTGVGPGGVGHFTSIWRWAKIAKAVSATRGIVMMYGDEVIYPAYHASSGGRTEDSENYWTSYVPYLRSVDDPYSARTAMPNGSRRCQERVVDGNRPPFQRHGGRRGARGEANGDAGAGSPARDIAEPESLRVESSPAFPAGGSSGCGSASAS